MSILNPNHLFEQAEKLIAAPSAGPPRQADLRRSISSAYYGLFHFTLLSLADEFVGVSLRTTSRYALVYRSVSHSALKDLCGRITRGSLPQKYALHVPPGGFGADLLVFAHVVADLQELRHLADYDPMPRFRTSQAKTAIETGRSGMRKFRNAPEAERKAFLTLLLCPPR